MTGAIVNGRIGSNILLHQCRAYHAGERYYVEVDLVMDENTTLKISNDISQALQRKIEGI